MVPAAGRTQGVLAPQEDHLDLEVVRWESRPPPEALEAPEAPSPAAGASCVFSAESGCCCGCDCDLSSAIYCAAQVLAHLAVDTHHLVVAPLVAALVALVAAPRPASPEAGAAGRRRARHPDRARGRGYVVSSSPTERSTGRRWGSIHARTMPSSYLFGRVRTPSRCGPGRTILRSLDRPSRCSGNPGSTASRIRR